MAKQYHTKGKEILLTYFMGSTGKRFCAKDVIDYLNDCEISMNQATVYRNLEKLTEEGKLLKTKNPSDDTGYYQYVGDGSCCREHLHIQCKVCGKIVHLEGPVMDSFNDYVQNELNFVLEPKESVLIGKCPDCIDKESEISK